MHEYPKSHPMYRAPKFGLNPQNRALLIEAIDTTLRETLGQTHEQVASFQSALASGVNDERLVSVAKANGAMPRWRQLKGEA